MTTAQQIDAVVAPQLEKLDTLIRTATAAREQARQGNLFASIEGVCFLNAIYDLTEVDAVYDFADDVRRECGLFGEAA